MERNLRKDIIEALNLGEPEVVPVAPYISDNYAPKLFGLKISEFILGSSELKAKVLINAFERFRYNWVMVGLYEPKNWLESVRIVDKGDRYELLDKRDGRLVCLLPKDDTPVYGSWLGFGDLKVDEAIERMESEIEDYKEILRSGRCEVAKIVSQKVGKVALVTAIIGAPFGEVVCRLGLKETALCLRKRPDLIKKLSELVVRRYIEEAKALIEAGAEAFWVEEVFADASTISPKHFEEIALPYEKMEINELKRLGVYTILYFCGNAMPVIEKIASINAHAFAFEEDKKGFKIDMPRIRSILKGRACLFGNFDTINVLRKSPMEVEERVKEMILKLAPGGGFVLGTGSPVLKDVPPENIDAMIAAARKYGRKDFLRELKIQVT
ncbi:MAG: hypothetical protein LM601_01670 [Candidatus Verstraetearchaeota archaeon]|jgi:hypothetical protein|nr:hypothetical protein [Candidatus Verstraetearchaeota archaeon]